METHQKLSVATLKRSAEWQWGGIMGSQLPSASDDSIQSERRLSLSVSRVDCAGGDPRIRISVALIELNHTH